MKPPRPPVPPNQSLPRPSQTAPPVYRAPDPVARAAGQGGAPPVYRPEVRAAVQRKGLGTIQRYCGTPGCNNPLCTDPSNHGHQRVFGLRGRNVYYSNVDATDVGTGTGTSQGTRNYVNSPTTPYPQQVRIEYSTGPTGGYSSFTNQPLAPGQRADAGHIFGAQYGGFGNQNASVFPQHPQTNRGNSFQGQSTSHLWRGHEDTVRREAQSGHPVDVSVALHNAPRPTVRNCPNCGRTTFTVSPNCPHCHNPLP